MIELISGYAPPTRDEGTEETLRKALKNLDPLLDVKWVPTVFWNQLKNWWEGRYSLTVDWPQADKRWEMVKTGEVDPKDAHDIVGWLCEDMQEAKSVPTSLDGIENRVFECLGQMDNTRYPWKQRFLSNIEANKKNRERIKNEATEEFVEEAKYLYRKLYDVPMVPVGNVEFSKEK